MKFNYKMTFSVTNEPTLELW